MSADTGSGRPGRAREIRKETSECEVRAALILTKSTLGSGMLSTAIKVCWVTMRSRLHTCGMDRVLVSDSVEGLYFLLDGRLRFTCDGECVATHYRRFGVLRVVTVRGRQVNGEAAVVTEALEAAAFLLFLGELAICSNAWVGPTNRRGIG